MQLYASGVSAFNSAEKRAGKNNTNPPGEKAARNTNPPGLKAARNTNPPGEDATKQRARKTTQTHRGTKQNNRRPNTTGGGGGHAQAEKKAGADTVNEGDKKGNQGIKQLVPRPPRQGRRGGAAAEQGREGE